MDAHAEIADLVRRRQVAFVVGTGLTMASTTRVDISWQHVIRRGVDYAVETSGKDHRWKQTVADQLDYGMEANDVAMVTAAASQVSAALGGQDGPLFAAWMRSEFEDLDVVDPRLIDLLGRADAPILTTNYDATISRRLQREPATWRDPRRLERVINGRGTEIGHLHGYWNDPGSVIFGELSYGSILEHKDVQHLQRALASTRSLIFVGCGAGLDDPNIGGLLSWMSTNLPDSEVFHYILCRSGEVPEGLPPHVRAVSYGSEHDDLYPFLASLVLDSGISSDGQRSEGSLVLARAAADHLLEQLRGETLLADHVDDLDRTTLLDIALPPVILPVTQQQFIDSQELPPDKRLRRCQLPDEAAFGSRMLLVADERSGLSTALRWLIHEVHENDNSIAPIFVDFRSLPTGLKPLRKRIIQELRLAGFSPKQDDPLPRLALAIDNTFHKPEKVLERVLADIGDLPIGFLAIGTREGVEHALLPNLRTSLPDIRVRYLGRLNSGDIHSLASLIAPTRSDVLARRTIEILNHEHLPRTPFTVCLLLTALIQGQNFSAAASETALLDDYVTLLLGGGDPHDDARVTMDAYERTQILAVLAKAFVERNSGSLTLEEVAHVLRLYFDEVDWSEDPLDVILNLRGRHVIKNVDGFISFTQASFLHLFAARAALTDDELRNQLFADPLYYAQIVRHYAALNRADSLPLQRVAGLLVDPSMISTGSGGHFFGHRPESDRVLDSSTVDELLDSLNLPEVVPEEPLREAEDESTSVDFLDTVPDKDLDPFPADNLDEAPAVFQIIGALTLVSNVLRDSEMVRDLDLKTQVLTRTLAVWGKLVVLLEEDESFQEFIGDLALRLVEDAGADLSASSAAKFVEGFRANAPALIGLGAMNSSLATRKLIRSLERVFADEEFIIDPFASVMGAFLSFGINGKQWPAHFRSVQEAHPRVRAVDSTMLHLAVGAYYLQQMPEKNAEALETFIATQYMSKTAAPDHRTAKVVAGRVRQQLRRNRALRSREQLPKGATILENPESLETLPPDPTVA